MNAFLFTREFELYVDEVVKCIKSISNDTLLPTLFQEEKGSQERSTFVILVWVNICSSTFFLS
jgi:hypothetical protein